jgi:hypothetical protein
VNEFINHFRSKALNIQSDPGSGKRKVIEMKKLLNTTLIALSLVTVFASASLAIDENADEYEFTVLYNDVEVEFPGEVSKEECDDYSRLQNRTDLTVQAFQYDTQISEVECDHLNHGQKLANKKIENILNDLGFDG